MWIDPGYTQVLRRLGSFARTVLFDARGAGLSDPLDHVPTVEEGADDLEAVMDAARLEHAVLLAMGTAYPAAAVFAARAPERVDGLVLVQPWAVGVDAVEDTSSIVGYDERMRQAMVGWVDAIEHYWGEGRTIELVARSIATERVKRNWGLLERAAASPAMIRAVTQLRLPIEFRAGDQIGDVLGDRPRLIAALPRDDDGRDPDRGKYPAQVDSPRCLTA
jgi:pimeloyl-ACP methyl ester carboxylesterase